MELTDFLGKQYGPGDLVIYGAHSGRSINMIVGRVVDIWLVYRDREKYTWKRLDEGQEPPLVPYGDKAGQPEETCERVRVQPLRGARWQQHHARWYYVDTRTGKRIDPFRSARYVLKDSHFVYADGTEFDYAAEKAKYDARWLGTIHPSRFDDWVRGAHQVWHHDEPGYDRQGTYIGPGTVTRPNLWWISTQFHPWVEQRKDDGPKPVTLEVTDNIVKWEGELPGEIPDEVP